MQAKRILLRCLLCAALTASLAAQDVHRDFTVEEGEREAAPRFHAKSLDGAQFTNESTKGKVVLLQFWTTWCPYCKSEETLVNNLTTEFADKGLLVRAVDFPTGATLEEVRRQIQGSGGARFAALPSLVYRVYPDGHEELERSLRFRGVTPKSFRDILAASEENEVLNFLDTPAPLAYLANGFVTNASVIAPGVLFDELELEPNQQDVPKPAIVPPPPLRSVE